MTFFYQIREQIFSGHNHSDIILIRLVQNKKPLRMDIVLNGVSETLNVFCFGYNSINSEPI